MEDTKTPYTILAVVGKNNELGADNKLLIHLPDDLRRFKKRTQENVVIMGRKTAESIGKELPNRINIVISTSVDFKFGNATIVNSFEKALEAAKEYLEFGLEIFVIGGGVVYSKAVHNADKIILTRVRDTFTNADTFFPEVPKDYVLRISNHNLDSTVDELYERVRI